MGVIINNQSSGISGDDVILNGGGSVSASILVLDSNVQAVQLANQQSVESACKWCLVIIHMLVKKGICTQLKFCPG